MCNRNSHFHFTQKNKIFISRFFASCRTYMQYIYAFLYSIFLISINSFYTKKNMIFISRFFASCRKDTLQYAFSYSIFIISITYHIPTYTKKSLYISVHSIHSEIKTFIQRCQKMATMKDIYIFLSHIFMYLDKNVCFHILRYQSHS